MTQHSNRISQTNVLGRRLARTTSDRRQLRASENKRPGARLRQFLPLAVPGSVAVMLPTDSNPFQGRHFRLLFGSREAAESHRWPT